MHEYITNEPFLQNDNNVLISCKFRNIGNIQSVNDILKSYYSRLNLLPPTFSSRFVLSHHSSLLPPLDLHSIPEDPRLETMSSKKESLEDLLRRLRCVRIFSSEGQIIKEEENLIITCAFGFRPAAVTVSDSAQAVPTQNMEDESEFRDGTLYFVQICNYFFKTRCPWICRHTAIRFSCFAWAARNRACRQSQCHSACARKYW